MSRAVFVTVLAAVVVLLAAGWPVGAQPALGRVSEPVVLAGSDLAAFAGAAPEELWVWIHEGGAWARIPSQLDERNAGLDYVAVEDGVLDANDELVFMAERLGGRRPDGSWPPGLDRDHPAVAVRVTDSLQPGFEGFAYVFRSLGGPEDALAPLVAYDEATGEVRARDFTLRAARPTVDGFIGVAYLSIFDGGRNLVDRMKVRVNVRLFGVLDQVLNEESEDLIALLPDALAPAIVGPVRIVHAADGSSLDYAGRSVRAGGYDLPDSSPLFMVLEVRTSLDLSPGVAGTTTYRDANVPDGVPVDGQPDVVPDRPVSAWRDLAFPEGRAVWLSCERAPGATAIGYYRDDATADPDDTGDGQSFGDSGTLVTDVAEVGPDACPVVMVAVPRGAAITGPQLLEQLDLPLAVEVTVDGGPTETPGAETPTPSVTPMPSAETSPTTPPTGTTTPVSQPPTVTPEPGGGRAFLPALSRQEAE